MNIKVRVGVVVLALAWASCGKGGSSSPTAPTVAAPAGCSGTAVERIEVSFSVSGGLNSGGVNVQLFGKTVDRQMAVGERFAITEDVVPCNYEITGQMLGANLSIGFGRTPPFKDFSGSVDKGVEKGSVVIVEGPNGVVSSSGNCRVDYRVPVVGSGGRPPPSDIKIRFRVSNSNAISGMGGGCG
jgi:hypothetical protein